MSGEFFVPLCFSPDGRFLLVNLLDNGTALFDWRTGKEIKRFPVKMLQASFTADSSKIICTGGGILCVYSVKSGKLLVSSAVDSEADWLTYTPEGYFTGSEGGVKNFVHVVDGMKVTELGQVAETFYRPDLVAAKLRGEDISRGEGIASLNSVMSSGDAPTVRFVDTPKASSARDAVVSFTVMDEGGGIGGVYVSLNGKVVQIAEGSRKFEIAGGTDIRPSGKSVTYSHTLTLAGGENTIGAWATNAAGKIESCRAEAKISWKGATAKPSLYVLAVGVNKYRDKSLWLNYAVPDALSIAERFSSARGGLYQSVNVTTLLDSEVTKAGLESALDGLSAKVGPDDVFVFYVSGHGMTHKDGDYYFIPADFRYRSADDVPQSGVSKKFLTDNLGKIAAQKTLILLDTCNSGAFMSEGQRGVAEKTALDRLCWATGQAVISASSETQVAMEGYNGHGIFTYVVLEALSGKADVSRDGYISVVELSMYIDEKVPDLSYEKWGYEQVPQRELRRMDFPLAEK